MERLGARTSHSELPLTIFRCHFQSKLLLLVASCGLFLKVITFRNDPFLLRITYVMVQQVSPTIRNPCLVRVGAL